MLVLRAVALVFVADPVYLGPPRTCYPWEWAPDRLCVSLTSFFSCVKDLTKKLVGKYRGSRLVQDALSFCELDGAVFTVDLDAASSAACSSHFLCRMAGKSGGMLQAILLARLTLCRR